MDVFFTILDDFNSLCVALVIIIMSSLLFKSTSNYTICYQIFTNTNNDYQIHDHEEFVDQVIDSESVIVANGAEFYNLTKALIISIVMQYKTTYFKHANNSNDNYNSLHCAYDHLIQYQVSMYREPFFSVETHLMVDENPIIELWRHLLNNTMKIQEIFTNASILILTELFGDSIKGKQCDVQEFDSDNTACLYSNDKTKDDFTSSITAASSEDDSITSHAREARIEYLQDTAAMFHTLVTNSTKYLSGKETKAAYYDAFCKMIRILALVHINMFVLRLHS